MSETVTETVEAPSPHDDIKSDIRAAIAERASSATPRAEPAATTETDTDTESPTSGQPRHPDGKFAPKTAAEDTSQGTEATPASTETQPPATAPAPDLAKSTATWSAADRALIQAAAPEVQELVLRREREREADYTRKTQQIAAFRRDYDPIEQMFAPYRPQMQQAGLTPAGMVKAWHDVEQDLMQGRGPDVISRIVQNYRIPVDQVARVLGIRPTTSQAAADPAQPIPEQQQPAIPPELQQVLHQYGERISAHEQLLIRQQQAAQQQAAHRVMSDIETFASATDKAGALLHPHFHELEDDMTRLVFVERASGREPDLSRIYEQAVWANTSTREKMLGDMQAASVAQQAQAEQQKREQARAKAVQAQRASSSVTGAPPPGQTPGRGEPQTLRDTIMAAVREHAAA